MTMRVLTWISRILFGAVFIFAGFTKAIDPLGSAYKFQDYFLAFGMESLFPLAVPLAIILNSLELLVGFMILFGLKMRVSSWAGLLFMAFFTPLTLYIAINNPVPDCGCFGDALVISNWETFYKNLIILVAAILIFTQRNKIKPLWSYKKDWYLVGGLAVLVIGVSLYSLVNLPLMDFRPWKVGNDMKEQLSAVQEEKAEFVFTYKNKDTGELKEFSEENLPTKQEKWEYVDRTKKVVQKGIPSPIDNFVIEDENSTDRTEEIIERKGYQFLVISYDLKSANKNAFNTKLKEIASGARQDELNVIVLTSNSFEVMDDFRTRHQLPFTFYQSDERELKTIIRSNPGLVLLKNGVVVDKWHHTNIPSYEYIKKNFLLDR